MIMGGVVIIFAFDPVDELEGGAGALVADAELGHRLVAEHRAELLDVRGRESNRYVIGSAAHAAARDELRTARGRVGVRKGRQASKLESP
jgi:hypothetical protein